MAQPSCGAPRDLGRIRPGFEADFVLLARNALERVENSRTIVTVIADGLLISDVVSLDQADARSDPSRR